MWVHAENGHDKRPTEVDDTSSKLYVYVRRNVNRVEANKGEMPVPAHWEWDELRVPRDSWEAWEQADANADAIAEIAEMASANEVGIEDISQAIVELAAMIGGE